MRSGLWFYLSLGAALCGFLLVHADEPPDAGRVTSASGAGKSKLPARRTRLLRAPTFVSDPAAPSRAVVLRQENGDPRKHWAFRAPVRPGLPPVRNAAWVRNAIDRFILARLEKERLSPTRTADRVTLIRRLSLDLIGLPPTIKEVDDFVNDKSPDAYDKLVERLLASPHFGERWARLWLDLARYADSDGFEKDMLRLDFLLPRLGHRRAQSRHAV